jgi:hypothetical protein
MPLLEGTGQAVAVGYSTDRAHSCAEVVVVWFSGVIDRLPGIGTIGPPQVTPFGVIASQAECRGGSRSEMQQLPGEQHECSQTAGNGIPLRGASEFPGDNK